MEKIEHKAIVVKKDVNNIYIKTQKEGSCESCPIFSCCKIIKNEEIKLPVPKNSKIKIGDEIVFVVDAKTQNLGILLLYGLPTLIIFVTLCTMFKIGFSDILSSLSAFCLVAVYYFALYLLRKNINVNFNIKNCGEKTDE